MNKYSIKFITKLNYLIASRFSNQRHFPGLMDPRGFRVTKNLDHQLRLDHTNHQLFVLYVWSLVDLKAEYIEVPGSNSVSTEMD